MGLYRKRDGECGRLCPCAAWPEEPELDPTHWTALLANQLLPTEGVE